MLLVAGSVNAQVAKLMKKVYIKPISEVADVDTDALMGIVIPMGSVPEEVDPDNAKKHRFEEMMQEWEEEENEK